MLVLAPYVGGGAIYLYVFKLAIRYHLLPAYANFMITPPFARSSSGLFCDRD